MILFDKIIRQHPVHAESTSPLRSEGVQTHTSDHRETDLW